MYPKLSILGDKKIPNFEDHQKQKKIKRSGKENL